MQSNSVGQRAAQQSSAEGASQAMRTIIRTMSEMAFRGVTGHEVETTRVHSSHDAPPRGYAHELRKLGDTGKSERWNLADGSAEIRTTTERYSTLSCLNRMGKTTEMITVLTLAGGEQFAEIRTPSGVVVIVGSSGYLGLEPDTRYVTDKDGKTIPSMELAPGTADEVIAGLRAHVLR